MCVCVYYLNMCVTASMLLSYPPRYCDYGCLHHRLVPFESIFATADAAAATLTRLPLPEVAVLDVEAQIQSLFRNANYLAAYRLMHLHGRLTGAVTLSNIWMILHSR